MTSSIIKLDKPYPVVYYEGRLLLLVGTLFVVSENYIRWISFFIGYFPTSIYNFVSQGQTVWKSDM